MTALGRLAVVGVAARRALAAPPLLLALALALLVALPGLALALLVLALALLAALLALFVALLVALLVLGPLGPPLLLRGLVLDLLRQLLDEAAGLLDRKPVSGEKRGRAALPLLPLLVLLLVLLYSAPAATTPPH